MSKRSAKIVREVAAEGIVLLENIDNCLPLNNDNSVALVGKGCFEYLKGGYGSAEVVSNYTIGLLDGLLARKAKICDKSLQKNDVYDLETLNNFAKESKTALVMLTRNTGEGRDRAVSDFNLSFEEEQLFELLDKSNFNEVVVLLNIGHIINIAAMKQYKKIKAILLVWFAGMEGGNAICDVLYGDVTPSGKLTDTIAQNYYDYPSSDTFHDFPFFVNYKEDIFVGYRYFETFSKEKVVYPFGYGLSYTTFAFENVKYDFDDTQISVSVTVKNVGNRAGKEVVQIYSSSPKSDVLKSLIELRAYEKTKLLQPGEEQTLTLSFSIDDMAYFDERRASYVLEEGIYSIFMGSNVRDCVLCGEYKQNFEKVVYSTTLKFSFGLPYKINEDGKFVKTTYWGVSQEQNSATVFTAGAEGTLLESRSNSDDDLKQERNKYSLYDVEEGKISLETFIKTMTSAQIIEMTMGQPPALIRGTAGIGNIPSLKIPNPQTADGPAGVRSTIPTLCFPCATLLACTWNDDILFSVGAAMGDDAISNDVDILLAPGLNIHRDPLCGRNFEYYSEEPIVSGRSAAAIVRGMQSKGVGATIKHLAFNNKEENRRESISIVSERAIREIYLKGFNIAIKEGNPWCVMTSYNLINGIRTAMHDGLLKGILREEWGYDGLVMTDWHVNSHLWREIKAGSNIKMPCGYPEEIQQAKDHYKGNLISRKELEECARYILQTVMKTRRFKERNFGKTQKIDEFNILDFICLSATWSGTKREDDGTLSLTDIGLDRRGNDTFIDYRIENDKTSEFILRITASCLNSGQSVEIFMDGEKLVEVDCNTQNCSFEKFYVFESKPFVVPEGVHEIRSYVRGAKASDSIHYKKWEFIRK